MALPPLMASACAQDGTAEVAGPANVGRATRESQPPGVHQALAVWRDGRESAVQLILKIAESEDAQKLLRVCNMTESQFVAIPSAQLEVRSLGLADEMMILRQLAGELVSRAVRENDAGDRAAARRYLQAARQLGAANRGPEVPLLADMCGKAIEKQAAEALANLQH